MNAEYLMFYEVYLHLIVVSFYFDQIYKEMNQFFTTGKSNQII